MSVPPGPFPPIEELVSKLNNTNGPTVCTAGGATDNAGIPNPIVSIVNKVVPPEDFPFVWYVSDADTTVSNLDGFDGAVNPIFFIDSPASFGGLGCGSNCPLVFESMIVDGIWQSGEEWHIVLQDFTSPGALPENFNSIGVGFPSTGSALATESGGSIVVLIDHEVGGTSLPIDTTALLVAGAQTNTPWLILGALSAVGIGLAVFTLKRNR